MAALLDRVRYCMDVGNTLFHRREEVKNGAVVPNIISAWSKIGFGNVRSDPVNAVGSLFQTYLCHLNGGLGDIENRDVLKASRKKVVYESGFTAAHVYDRC
jgi:hypothetical protein